MCRAQPFELQIHYLAFYLAAIRGLLVGRPLSGAGRVFSFPVHLPNEEDAVGRPLWASLILAGRE